MKYSLQAKMKLKKAQKDCLKLKCVYIQLDETIHFGNVGNEFYFFVLLFINHVSLALLLSYSFHATTINLHPQSSSV